jgi:hypothetical protein
MLEKFYMVEIASGETGAEYWPLGRFQDIERALKIYQVRKNIGSKVRLVECNVIEQSKEQKP